MWLAAHHPERVGRLALLCTSAPSGQPAELAGRACGRFGPTAWRRSPTAVVDRWITPALKQRDPGLVRSLRDMLLGTDPESYAQCCEVIGDLDLRADLDRIAAPTLVVGGADDPALPLEHQELIAAGVPGATLTVLPAAHLANIEQAGAVTQLLLRHFGAAATSRSRLRDPARGARRRARRPRHRQRPPNSPRRCRTSSPATRGARSGTGRA